MEENPEAVELAWDRSYYCNFALQLYMFVKTITFHNDTSGGVFIKCEFGVMSDE